MVLVAKILSADAGDVRDVGLNPESGRSLEEGVATQSRIPWEAWQAIVHSVAKSWIWLKWVSVHTHTHTIRSKIENILKTKVSMERFQSK